MTPTRLKAKTEGGLDALILRFHPDRLIGCINVEGVYYLHWWYPNGESPTPFTKFNLKYFGKSFPPVTPPPQVG